MQNALQENEAQAQRAEGGTTNAELKPGVTIDLSRKGIRELPEEVVDVIKHELERYDSPLNSEHDFFFPLPLLWKKTRKQPLWLSDQCG